MLEIRDLHVSVAGKQVIKGLNLHVRSGEVHAIMGKNGSGKSTLAYVLAGRDGYEITCGEVLYEGKGLCDLSPEQRAQAGLFLAFQYPVEIPGVNNIYLLKAAVNSVRVHRGEAELDAVEFFDLVKTKIKAVNMPEDLLERSVNEGFSGGEKKRNEVFQMALLEPKLAILDEIDSGLDIDALKTIAQSLDGLRNEHRSFVLITHYQRLLGYIIPDYVHVMQDGKITKSGDHNLAIQLEESGYGETEM